MTGTEGFSHRHGSPRSAEALSMARAHQTGTYSQRICKCFPLFARSCRGIGPLRRVTTAAASVRYALCTAAAVMVGAGRTGSFMAATRTHANIAHLKLPVVYVLVDGPARRQQAIIERHAPSHQHAYTSAGPVAHHGSRVTGRMPRRAAGRALIGVESHAGLRAILFCGGERNICFSS